jgi:hypothetical protein
MNEVQCCAKTLEPRKTFIRGVCIAFLLSQLSFVVSFACKTLIFPHACEVNVFCKRAARCEEHKRKGKNQKTVMQDSVSRSLSTRTELREKSTRINGRVGKVCGKTSVPKPNSSKGLERKSFKAKGDDYKAD